MSNELPPLPDDIEQAIYERSLAFVPQTVHRAIEQLMREYGRACQQADDELLRQAGFAFRSVWAIGLTGENVHLIEAAMLAIEARLGADK